MGERRQRNREVAAKPEKAPHTGVIGAPLDSIITIDVINEIRYAHPMIVSFRDADAELLWQTGRSRRIPAILRNTAWKKLAILNAAIELDNLKVPPGNRLEALKGDRKGQHSIRINDQYRICFEWRDNSAHNIEIVDYH